MCVRAQLGASSEWDYSSFRRAHLAAYVAMTADFVGDALPRLLGGGGGSGDPGGRGWCT